MAYDGELADRVRDLVSDEPGWDERRMFGGLAFLRHGHMAVGVSGQGGLMARVDPAETDDLLAEPGAAPFVMRGRPMTGWLRVDAEGLEGAALEGWVARCRAYVATLPPKD